VTSATSDSRTLGGRLQEARERQGLTVSETAKLSGVQSKTIKNWELDRSEPRSNKLVHLAGVLGVSMSYLLDGQTGDGPLPQKTKADVIGLIAELEERSEALSRDIARAAEDIHALNRDLAILRQIEW
jgi:transcriptional regulator with XRE-family HTH domain